MKKLLMLGIAGALAGGLSVSAYAQAGSAKTEIKTAHAHAMMAQGASKLDMVHTHLHHVINCLVGPDGQGFDASAGNPCKGQGNGAIPDSAGNSALQGKLKSALSDAQAGLKADKLSAAQADAAKAEAALQVTPSQKSSGGYSW